MRMQVVSLRGRRFLVQFSDLMAEFGAVIPWLHGMETLLRATNGSYFRDELLARTCRGEGDITPYQFVDPGRPGVFVGGLLAFSYTPERLEDPHNRAIVERLSGEGAGFISCLQVRPERRSQGVGTQMMKRALTAIRAERGQVWGVASNPLLLPWYRSLGAQTPSRIENRDALWIVHW